MNVSNYSVMFVPSLPLKSASIPLWIAERFSLFHKNGRTRLNSVSHIICIYVLVVSHKQVFMFLLMT